MNVLRTQDLYIYIWQKKVYIYACFPTVPRSGPGFPGKNRPDCISAAARRNHTAGGSLILPLGFHVPLRCCGGFWGVIDPDGNVHLVDDNIGDKTFAMVGTYYCPFLTPLICGVRTNFAPVLATNIGWPIHHEVGAFPIQNLGSC